MVRGLLTAPASLAAGHGRWGVRASGVVAYGLSGSGPRLERTGSLVAAQRLGCFTACGIFQDQSPALAGDSLLLNHQGSALTDSVVHRIGGSNQCIQAMERNKTYTDWKEVNLSLFSDSRIVCRKSDNI